MRQIEFLPIEYLRRRQRHYLHLVRRWFTVALAMTMVLWWSNMNRQFSKELGKLTAIQSVTKTVDGEVGRVASLDKERLFYDHQACLIEELSAGIRPTTILAELSQQQPPNVWLSQHEIICTKPDNPPRGNGDIQVRLAGYAPDEIVVAQYLESLRSNPLFAEVTLIRSAGSQSEGQHVQAFEIVLDVVTPVKYQRSKTVVEAYIQ